jgi:hypothetical protein
MNEHFRGHILAPPNADNDGWQHPGFTDPAAAWQFFLEQFVTVVRKAPEDSQFWWRLIPELREERNFDRGDSGFKVVARLTEKFT